MEMLVKNNELKLLLNRLLLLDHSPTKAGFFYGYGYGTIESKEGHFSINDYLEQRIALRDFIRTDNGLTFIDSSGKALASLTVQEEDNGRCQVTFRLMDTNANRIWLRIPAVPGEHVYGGGEQFSYFDLRGKSFHIFTREQGVGRNKSEYITFLADTQLNGGGEYDWTFFPQPTFISSKGYYFHLNSYSFSILDFSHEYYHEVEIWDNQCNFTFDTADNPKTLVSKLTDYLGRQPEVPDWALKGVWLGIQGGTDVMLRKLKYMKKIGTDVSAVWCQDWEGIQMTSFGKRLMWNWEYDSENYPNLPETIRQLNQENIQFLGYMNPYVREGKSLFQEAEEKDLLLRDQNGDIYLVDFGEFLCGVVDLTRSEGFDWYKEIIKKNLIGIGMSGWMADFGEYLPVDCVVPNRKNAVWAHNEWPVLWAKVNYEALKETGMLGKAAVFFRSGATGSQKYAPIIWAGDQNVDWTLDDGLASVIVAALSLGMSGHGMHTSDCGGYTTVFHLQRSRELLMRWAEFSAFTPIFRTHEGNRPEKNHQFDSDEITAKFFARMSQIHTALFPYTKELMKENCKKGIPVMRPLFLEYPEDEETYNLKYQYMLGPDMIVAPVYTENAEKVSVYCPSDCFIHLWTGEQMPKGFQEVEAPLGYPAVFYRRDSEYATVFDDIKYIYK